MIRITCKHLLDVCFADESHPVADSWCRQFTLVYQLVNVLTGASHEDGSLGECKVLLAGDVYNRLDSLQKVLLPFLALSLCCLGALFEQYLCEPLLQVNSLPQKAHFLVFLIWLLFMWFYNQFHANRHGVNFRQSLTILVNSFHDVTFFKWDHFLASFPLVLQSTVVHFCQPLSTLSTRWQNKSPQNSPR